MSLSIGVSTRNASGMPIHGNLKSKSLFIERFGLNFLILRFVFQILHFYLRWALRSIYPNLIATIISPRANFALNVKSVGDMDAYWYSWARFRFGDCQPVRE